MVLRLLLLASLLALACSSGACSTSPAQPEAPEQVEIDDGDRRFGEVLGKQTTRAMWLWNEPPGSRAILANRDSARDELLGFMRAPHDRPNRRINRLFFQARGFAPVDRKTTVRPVTFDPLVDHVARETLREFIALAHRQGAKVEYLDGQALWLASDENARVPKKICRDVVAFNLVADRPEERLAGVHLDIEPHTLISGPYARKWWQNRLPHGYNARWTARWKAIVEDCRKVFDAYHARTGHRLTLACDVGPDFAHYNRPLREFFDQKASPLDYVSVLNYYDDRDNRVGEPAFFFGAHDGERIVGGVRQNLALWKEVPVIFGVETGPPSIAPDARSFHQEGYEAMYRILDKLRADYDRSNYLGVAIHHYGPDAYREMKP